MIASSMGHHREWLQPCRTGSYTTCNFDYSGPLSETVLLGNAAYRAGGSFAWDAGKLSASGNENAAQYIRPEFREGWKV